MCDNKKGVVALETGGTILSKEGVVALKTGVVA